MLNKFTMIPKVINSEALHPMIVKYWLTENYKGKRQVRNPVQLGSPGNYFTHEVAIIYRMYKSVSVL